MGGRKEAVKVRLDRLLVERGLASSRERAQALILAGRVMAGAQKAEKCGLAVDAAAEIRLLGEARKYVSRGGTKLEAALQHWGIDLTGRRCADIGASTGGFSDCMLQHGASLVVAVDTGYGQIAEPLRRESRIVLMERTNARYLAPARLPPGISFLAMDVSFISATLVLPAVLAAIGRIPTPPASHLAASLDIGASSEGSPPEAAIEAVILVKPQFEAGREKVGKGGIVRDAAAHQMAVGRVRETLLSLGAWTGDPVESPILGGKGNREFLLYARFRGSLGGNPAGDPRAMRPRRIPVH